MKPFAYVRHKYSGEMYKFVRKTVGDVSTVEYYFAGNVLITAGIDTNGKLIIKSDQPFALGTLIANIRDSNNNLILDDVVYQISSLQPVLNAFSNFESYTMKTVKYQGTL